MSAAFTEVSATASELSIAGGSKDSWLPLALDLGDSAGAALACLEPKIREVELMLEESGRETACFLLSFCGLSCPETEGLTVFCAVEAAGDSASGELAGFWKEASSSAIFSASVFSAST